MSFSNDEQTDPSNVRRGEVEQSEASLLEVKNLSVEFNRASGFLEKKKNPLIAVRDVSFAIRAGETLGLVGESGCGKSTLGKALLRLLRIKSGDIFFLGRSIRQSNAKDLRGLRRHMQMIFQDPYSSLNPRMKIRDILEEPLIIHRQGSRSQIKERVLETLSLVGLREDSLERFPHEFSGGQRQRIGIARALMLRPKFLVCDEAVSALDVSIQAQILNLLKDLQESLNLTYLFISHDLNVVQHLCDRVVVMYLGRVMEILPVQELRHSVNRHHPYTEALLASAPRKHPNEPKQESILQGDLPSPTNPPSGCVFRTRCREAVEACSAEVPALKFEENRWVACLKRGNKMTP